MKTTGVILASGEGSRLKELCLSEGVPKHLLPIGKDSIISRTLKSLEKNCSELLIIVKAEHEKTFSNVLLPNFPKLRIGIKKESGFSGDFKAIDELIKTQLVIITVGDLIFPSDVVEQFTLLAQKNPNRLRLGLDSQCIKALDFRIVISAFPASFLSEMIQVNPESFKQVAQKLIALFLKNRVRLNFLPTLFNVNTPECYLAAKSHFR
jgi:NDP-sugar pyrophosphorylase family protein